jgi:hypothetical protein
VQERYLGDSHDFLKYAFLRHMHKAGGWRIGLNWYLTHHAQVDRPGSNDGEMRHLLKGGKWQSLDPELLEALRPYDLRTNRRIADFERAGILPRGTGYFSELLRADSRPAWHTRAREALAASDLVFLDPDNGLEVKSMTARTAPKYALYAETLDYFRAGKIVIAIQFARQCDPIAKAHRLRAELCALAGKGVSLPVIRGRVAPNTLFLALAPRQQARALAKALTGFGAGNPLVELIA